MFTSDLRSSSVLRYLLIVYISFMFAFKRVLTLLLWGLSLHRWLCLSSKHLLRWTDTLFPVL